jgi:hypothetical protein
MILADPIVDWGSLWEAIYVSVLFGLGVLLIAAIGVAASLRSQDARVVGHGGASAALAGLTVVCVLALVAAVVAGIYLLTQ